MQSLTSLALRISHCSLPLVVGLCGLACTGGASVDLDQAINAKLQDPCFDKSCDDKNPCTDDTCQGGACVHEPNSAACSDNNRCTENEVCKNGTCGVAVNCDDANSCTTDSCEPATGCLHVALADASATPCDDGNACTAKDVCQAGKCVPGALTDCAPPKNFNVTFDNGEEVDNQWFEDDLVVNRSAGTWAGNGIGPTNWDTIDDDKELNLPNNGGQVKIRFADGRTFRFVSFHASGGTQPIFVGARTKTGEQRYSTVSHPASGLVHSLDETFKNLEFVTLTTGGGGGVNNHIIDDIAVIARTSTPTCKLAATCSATTGTCNFANAPPKTSCEDGNKCTEDDTCELGVCQPGPKNSNCQG